MFTSFNFLFFVYIRVKLMRKISEEKANHPSSYQTTSDIKKLEGRSYQFFRVKKILLIRSTAGLREKIRYSNANRVQVKIFLFSLDFV